MKKEITATLLYLIKDDQVLLALKKRGFGAGRFNGVGGKPEPDETIEQTLVRESQEEIDVTPIEFEKVAKISFDEQHKGERAIMNVHVYTTSKWDGTPTESEEMAPKWFNKKELPYDKMWPSDTLWFPQVMDGKKVNAHIELDENDIMVSHDTKVVKKL
jgi:8-oxo-dGTP pyrophosphatase MutT (NUDIX family)